MRIKAFAFNPLQVNTYVVYDESGECIIIDPACSDNRENNELESFITEKSLTPKMVIATHFHFDHLMGASFVCKTYNLELAGHKNFSIYWDKFGVTTQTQSFGFSMDSPPKPTIILDNDSVIRFGNSSLIVMHLPGHSICSIGLYSEKNNILFTGDVLFKMGYGRTDLPGGDYESLMHSITKKIFTLDHSTAIYPGHGPSSHIYQEINNF
ncbi:MAG: MBL fold hydrolase [Bacteroidetes bacterium HGW-Bacteroidetes-21]|jgi:glyoxylase-like metal-dependent hydrolase (beta-lactamase superfamily II)|nr:MAG: MBL fold hydrolase [Bacteroidetes bacterium HGW-Bacteroidetes-21]